MIKRPINITDRELRYIENVQRHKMDFGSIKLIRGMERSNIINALQMACFHAKVVVQQGEQTREYENNDSEESLIDAIVSRCKYANEKWHEHKIYA